MNLNPLSSSIFAGHADINFYPVFVTCILAATSPTHSTSADVYPEAWARDGRIGTNVNTYGNKLGLSHNGSETYGGCP